MTKLTGFFKDSVSTLGVFYPLHYIVATFPTFEASRLAVQALQGAGYSDEEAIAIPSGELLKFFEDFRADSGLWAGVMTMLSRGFGTEQAYADDDIHQAQGGAGFLAVRCLNEAETSRIEGTLKPFAPLAIHWYESGGVRSMI